jgi:hypothetical protein
MLLRNNAISINEVRLENGYDEIATDKTLDKISGLSPLVATKVVESLDINEIRSLVGLAPLTPEQIAARTPTPVETAVPKGGLVGLGTNEKTSNVPPAAYKVQIPIKKELDDLDIVWKKFDTQTKEAADKLGNYVLRIFNSIERELIGKANKTIIKGLNLAEKSLESEFEFDIDSYLKVFEKLAEKDITDLSIESIIDVLKGTGIDIGDNVSDEYAKVIANSLKESYSKIKESLDTLGKNIKDVVKEVSANANDLTTAELKKAIKEALRLEFQTIKQSRIDTIARTTSNNASNSAKDGAIKKNKLVKVWLTQRDGGERDAHKGKDGTEADESGYFNIGGEKLKYPTGGSLPENNINCRCTIIARKSK